MRGSAGADSREIAAGARPARKKGVDYHALPGQQLGKENSTKERTDHRRRFAPARYFGT